MFPDKEIADFAQGYLGALLAKYDSSSWAKMRCGSLHALLAKYAIIQYGNSNNPQKRKLAGKYCYAFLPCLVFGAFRIIVNTFGIMLNCY